MNDLIKKFVAEVSVETGVAADWIVGKSRKRPHVRARWRVWALLKERHWSAGQIARAFGQDHTSVLWGLQRLGVSTDEYVPTGPVSERAVLAARRRAKIIARYWYAKGVIVKVEAKNGQITSTGIPLRASP